MTSARPPSNALSPVWVAAIQMSSQSDVTRNLKTACALVEAAAQRGAEIAVLPENFAFMGEEEDKRAIAESESDDGPILATLRDLARRAKVHLVAGGMPEKSGDALRPYNTSFLVSPSGEVTARYRKVHLFDVEIPNGPTLRESAATTAGDLNVTVAPACGTLLGMTICYDLRFPELFRALGGQGARIVTVPAAFTLTTGKDHWHTLLKARAIENQVFVIAAAQHGHHPKGRTTYGKSLIIDPWGDVLAQVGEGEGYCIAQLDFAYQDKVRAGLPCLAHRRLP